MNMYLPHNAAEAQTNSAAIVNTTLNVPGTVRQGGLNMYYLFCAQKGTRTPTRLLSLAPEASASTNSAIRAKYLIKFFNEQKY